MGKQPEPESKNPKLHSCVRDLKAKGYSEQSAYAICKAKLGAQAYEEEKEEKK